MRSEIIELFKVLAAIDSPSGQEGAIAEKVMSLLAGRGFSPKQDPAGNIIAVRGRGEPLLLCCHLDTVESTADLEVRIEGDYIKSGGNTILGADDKAGIAIVLATLASMESVPPIELIFSVGEETGMEGTKSLKEGDLQARWGLVLDAGEPVGAVINRAPGESDLEILIHGRGAHAAANPEQGIDAIRLAAGFIERLPPHRLEKDSTFNIGVIRGGAATNTICPRVQLLGEVRSFDDAQRRSLVGELEGVLEKALAGSGGSFELKSRDSYPGYLVPADHGLIGLLRKTARPLEIEVDVHSRFAGSDANSLNGLGLTVVNLGIGVEGNHSFAERVSIPEMAKMGAWLKAILEEWANARP